MDAARRCGLAINDRTLGRTEVEASCPFCGDHGPGKYHLSLNTDKDVYRCNLCGEHGNSVTLYARRKHVTNREAYEDLTGGSNTYLLPARPEPRNTEREPAGLAERDAVYREMLSYLTLSDAHHANLRERGLSDERIEENGYRSMPDTYADRRLLARLIRADHDLLGIPGFYTRYGEWTLAGPNGFFIPVRNKEGAIQGLKIRLDTADAPNRDVSHISRLPRSGERNGDQIVSDGGSHRKYRWFSSRDKHLINGTRSYSWIHVTGDRSRKRAYLTEGPLKGDVASYLANDALFICTGGVNAIHGLRETIEDLGVSEVVEAMDMDQMTNPNVRNGILTMRKEVMKIPNIKYSKYTWNPDYKGVDDYFLSRVAAM